MFLKNQTAQKVKSAFFYFFSTLFIAMSCQLAVAQTTGYSGTGANIDVNYYRCVWTIDPGAAKNIAGNVTTYFKTTQSNVTNITIDLNRTSFNNGSLVVKYHGSTITATFPTTANILRITLPAALGINVLDSFTVNYSGAPPAVVGQAEGCQIKTVNANKVFYTLSESYEDRDWWPCKADMQDKADSLDIYITTPSAYLPAANGVMKSNTVTGGNRTVYYKHRYPVASYLVAVAVAAYTDYPRGTVNISGTNMPVNYFILSNRSSVSTQLAAMDFCKQELVAFSNVFGDYPFKDEKYGMYEFGWGGGMEHQSFSAMGWVSMSDWGTIAHELAHQWWGDKVTFATWNHLWLAEGFARYSEALAAELVSGLGQNPATVRSGFKSVANNTTNRNYGCILPNASIVTSDVLWSSAYGTTVYERGAMIVSMLRTLMGDAKFFQACKNYLSDPALAYKSAVTDDFRAHCEAVLGGRSLAAFFDDFVTNGGYPNYSIKWGNNGTRVNIQVASQTKVGTSPTTYYSTPVVVKMSNGVKDTTVVIFDEQTTLSYAGDSISAPLSRNVMAYVLSFVPTTVTFDPYIQTLATGTVAKDPALNNVMFSLLPIDIINYSATPKDGYNLLSLKIATTEDKPAVTQERSINGVDFISLGEMLRTNSEGEEANYQFLDRNINPAQSYYYRAKTQDSKGLVRYSKTLRITTTDPSSLSLAPNPANKQVVISWEKNTGSVELKITSLSGQLVYTKKTNEASLTVNTEKLLAGTYLVQVIQNNVELLSRKLLIRR